MRKLFVCLLAALLLCGCGPAAPAETTPTIEETTAPATEPPRVTVYPNAVVDFLGEEGNGHDFSWEQIAPPEYVMIHFCSAVVNHRDDPYNLQAVRQTFVDADVSIHYLLDREGTVYCYIPEDRSAWHAGVGTWLNDEKYTNKMNLYSIGIEVMGIGSYNDMRGYLTQKEYKALPEEHIGFTDAQYKALKELVADICKRNNIPLDREHIIGHQEFSPKKKDPGELFDWGRILPLPETVITVKSELTENDGVKLTVTNLTDKVIDSARVYTLWFDQGGEPLDVGGEAACNQLKVNLPELGPNETKQFTIPAEEGAGSVQAVAAAVYFADGTDWEK